MDKPSFVGALPRVAEALSEMSGLGSLAANYGVAVLDQDLPLTGKEHVFQVQDMAKEWDFSVLVLDDDPTFLKIAEQYARRIEVRTMLCADLEEAKNQLRYQQPDAVIADFQIEEGSFVLDHMHIFGNTPLVLTSRKTSWIPEELPDNVRLFIAKKYGIQRIMNDAIKLAGWKRV